MFEVGFSKTDLVPEQNAMGFRKTHKLPPNKLVARSSKLAAFSKSIKFSKNNP